MASGLTRPLGQWGSESMSLLQQGRCLAARYAGTMDGMDSDLQRRADVDWYGIKKESVAPDTLGSALCASGRVVPALGFPGYVTHAAGHERREAVSSLDLARWGAERAGLGSLSFWEVCSRHYSMHES